MRKIIFVLFVLLIVVYPIYSVDNLAADDKVKKYRTDEMDPVLSTIPKNLQENVFKNPEEYLDDLVNFLVRNTNDDYLKVKRIHDWITDNIAYDSDLFYGTGTGSRKPYAFLLTKRTTCGGYARLLKLMCDLAGIEAVYISGYSKSYFIKSSNKVGNHAWNAVKINGKWYLVDSTSDNRQGYKNGEFSEKKEYTSKSLFLHPEAKILRNLPYEEKYQFIEKKVSFEEFMNAPRVQYNFFGYKASFVNDIKQIVKEGREEREGGNQFALFDMIELEEAVAEIKLRFPENVVSVVRLYEINGEEDNRIYNHSISYKDGITTVCQFSPPNPGEYKARISVKYINEEGYYHTVYSFRIKAKKKGIFLPKSESTAYLKNRFILNDIKINSSDLSCKNGYYKIDISFPPNISVYSKIEDSNGEYSKDNIVISYHNSRKIYYYKPPGIGTYFIKIYSKNLNNSFEKNHTTSAFIKVINNKSYSNTFPPMNELIFNKNFENNGFIFLEENINEVKTNKVYVVQVSAADEYTMSSGIKDKDNKNYNKHTTYSTDGKNYTFYFTPPGEGVYTAKIYQIDENGKMNTICYYYLKSKKKGLELPLKNKLHIFRKFYLNGMTLISDNIDNSSEGFYEIKVAVPPGIEMDCRLKNMNDKNQNGNYYYTKLGNEYTFQFSPPDNNEYLGRIYYLEDGKNYKLVAEFKIKDETKGENIPRPKMLYLINRFYRNNFKIISENITDQKEHDNYKIIVKCPGEYTMGCSLKDGNGNKMRGFYKTEKNGDNYYFYFTKPDNEYYIGKIYQIENEKTWKWISVFAIE